MPLAHHHDDDDDDDDDGTGECGHTGNRSGDCNASSDTYMSHVQHTCMHMNMYLIYIFLEPK